MNRHTFHLAFALLPSLGVGFAGVAFGGPLIKDAKSVCTTANCESQVIRGFSGRATICDSGIRGTR